MPVLPVSGFRTPTLQWNGHMQTIIPSQFRSIDGVTYRRERLDLPDGDFLDLDWLQNGHPELIILTHGLEGSSGRHYVQAPARLLHDAGYDVLAWNCRSCSGEMNRLPKLYHHGDILDLEQVAAYALGSGLYKGYHLIGFSMGGNIVLKYTALSTQPCKSLLTSTAAISAPIHLESSAAKMDHWPYSFYGRRFFRKLRDKLTLKATQFPGWIDPSHFDHIRRWRDFDEHYSAPINGYADADEFYYQSSSINFLDQIRHRSLLLQAQNDPVISEQCFPYDLAAASPHIHLRVTPGGGHTGFMERGQYFTFAERALLDWVSLPADQV